MTKPVERQYAQLKQKYATTDIPLIETEMKRLKWEAASSLMRFRDTRGGLVISTMHLLHSLESISLFYVHSAIFDELRGNEKPSADALAAAKALEVTVYALYDVNRLELGITHQEADEMVDEYRRS